MSPRDGDLVSHGSGIEPISVRIPTAAAMTGFSRSRLYELIATGEITIAKDRRCTLILVASLREAVARRIVPADLTKQHPSEPRMSADIRGSLLDNY